MNICSKIFRAIKYSINGGTVADYSDMPRPHYTIAFFLDGYADFVNETDRITFVKNDILFLPKGCIYKSFWKGNPKTEYYALHFDMPQFLEPFGDKDIPMQKIIGNEKIEDLFSYIIENSDNNNEVFSVMSEFYRLCDTVYHQLKYTVRPQFDERIRKSLIYIQENHTSPIKIDELAAMCYMSPSYFHYCFKRTTGLSPIDYKLKVSVDHACKLLLNDKNISIGEVSDFLGFGSESYFRRTFKKITGYSPREYRKNTFMM